MTSIRTTITDTARRLDDLTSFLRPPSSTSTAIELRQAQHVQETPAALHRFATPVVRPAAAPTGRTPYRLIPSLVAVLVAVLLAAAGVAAAADPCADGAQLAGAFTVLAGVALVVAVSLGRNGVVARVVAVVLAVLAAPLVLPVMLLPRRYAGLLALAATGAAVYLFIAGQQAVAAC